MILKRRSGIPLVGDLPWGSHFCLFYKTPEDLPDVLAPFLDAGLENNELCILITSKAGADAMRVLKKSVPHFERYERRGQVEAIPYSRWRTMDKKPGGAVVSMLDRAVSGGFDGLRLAYVFSSKKEAAKAVTSQEVDAISRYNLLAAYAYPRDDFDAPGLMDAIKDHRFALVRNADGWDVIESSEAHTLREELTRSEEKLKFLFSNMSEGFAYHRIVLNADGKPVDYVFLEVNDAFEKLTGLAAKNLIGRKVTEALPGIEKDPTGWIEKYGEVAMTGKPMRFESYAAPLGRWYSISAFSPHIGFFAVTFSDITERKISEEKLKEAHADLERRVEERTRELLENEKRLKEAEKIAHLGYWELDLVKNSLYWSDEIYRIFDMDPAEFGASYEAFLDKIHPEDREFVNKSYTDSVNNKTPYDIVHRLLMKDGSVKFVNEKCSTYYGEDGKPLRSAGTIHDITDRRKLEEQLRQSQKMEAVGQLAGGIAHDFNNRLAVILNNAFLLKTSMPVGAPLGNYLDGIIHSVENASSLTKGLLAFSRKQVITMRTVELNEIVKKSGSFLKRVIGEDIELKIKLSASPLPINADQAQIENVLINLAVNARDAMPDGGLLSVATGSVEIAETEKASYGIENPGTFALLTVSDMGVGMDEETRQRVFEPFFTTKETGKGTGLGLSMVYGIIQQHGGAITVYSEPGNGTTFRIYLPVAGAQAAASEVQKGRPEGGTETILIAEDAQDIREATKTLLERFGYKVIEAASGKEALEKFRKRPDIDLLLLDVLMPEINGKELYKEALKINPSVMALFLSGYPADLISKRGLLEEGLNYLPKPASPTALLTKIREIIGKK